MCTVDLVVIESAAMAVLDAVERGRAKEGVRMETAVMMLECLKARRGQGISDQDGDGVKGTDRVHMLTKTCPDDPLPRSASAQE